MIPMSPAVICSPSHTAIDPGCTYWRSGSSTPWLVSWAANRLRIFSASAGSVARLAISSFYLNRGVVRDPMPGCLLCGDRGGCGHGGLGLDGDRRGDDRRRGVGGRLGLGG